MDIKQVCVFINPLLQLFKKLIENKTISLIANSKTTYFECIKIYFEYLTEKYQNNIFLFYIPLEKRGRV